MKKTLTSILCMALAVCAADAEKKVVFLMNGGQGDGTSPEAAVSSFEDAFAAVDDDGGTIVLCGPFTQTANYPSSTLRKHTGEIKLTSVHDGIDYRETSGAEWVMSKGMRFQMGGPVRLADLAIRNTATSNNFLLLICNFNEFTMDKGVTSTGFTFTQVANSVTILGGCQDNLKNACGENPKINIAGGEALIVGFNRGTAKNFTTPKSPGTATLNISGGIIHNLFGGSVSNGLEGGNLDLVISGGKFTDNIYGGKYGSNVAGGDNLKMTVTGGDFSECKSITFEKAHPESQKVTVDIAGAGNDEFDILLSLSNAQTFDNLLTNYRLPMQEFQVGEEFTASNGIKIPYRIHIPADIKADASLPLLTFLHGNGSRGDDNEKQITSGGSCALISYLTYGEPCIIIAPQCPLTVDEETTMWMERDKYVGSDLYSVSNPQTPHLQAAAELINYISSQYNVNQNRLYLAGSSNGAGACWDLIVRNPGKFAAAVPVAGGREDKDLSQYGQILAQTPVWTFHGDADETLPVAGTRALVKAARDAGASSENCIYTEVPGADHNTIWKIAAKTPGVTEWMFSKTLRTTDVNEIAETDAIHIYPVRGGVETYSPVPAKLTVYSISGGKVAEFMFTGSETVMLDMPGVWMIRVENRHASKTYKVKS